jgi:hypothetical protein
MLVDFSSKKWDTGTRQNERPVIKWLNNITPDVKHRPSEEKVSTLSTVYQRCSRGVCRVIRIGRIAFIKYTYIPQYGLQPCSAFYWEIVMQSSVNKSESRTFFGHPYPLGSLFFTEMWERFSFYGIRPLLILFMAATVYDGGLGLARENASAIVGIFAGSMYLAALPGGWLADNWLGQRKAVWYGSILIALGHLSIALSAVMGTNLFFIGLMFIVHAVQERRCTSRRRFLAVLHGHQHRFVHRPADLRLADQVTRLALGLRHRRYRDAGGAGDLPGVRRPSNETL